MIDNVVLLITGTINDRPLAELVNKCHPLGIFDQMEAVTIANSPSELYNAILVDTVVGEMWEFTKKQLKTNSFFTHFSCR